MSEIKPRYLIFDVESIADGEVISRVKYPNESLTPKESINRFRAERQLERGSDFIPYTFQLPTTVVVAKVDQQCQLLDIKSLDEPNYRPHVMTKHFWTGWERYDKPTLVTFNGRQFDLPLLELAAFRFGIPLPRWFKGEKSNRNRYNQHSHLDWQEVLTNFGASFFHGGLNLIANMLGKPGKMGVQGCMVQDMYEEGRLQEVSDYCRCDVLDTYFVFLRVMLLQGEISLEQEHHLVAETKKWLEARQHECAAYMTYLESWGDWHDPWQE